ncbi:hypothetical protein MBANPS3_006459 [Mucor bainieri]
MTKRLHKNTKKLWDIEDLVLGPSDNCQNDLELTVEETDALDRELSPYRHSVNQRRMFIMDKEQVEEDWKAKKKKAVGKVLQDYTLLELEVEHLKTQLEDQRFYNRLQRERNSLVRTHDTAKELHIVLPNQSSVNHVFLSL